MTDQIAALKAQIEQMRELIPHRIPNGFVAFGKYYSEQEDIFANPCNKMSMFKKQYLEKCDAALATPSPTAALDQMMGEYEAIIKVKDDALLKLTCGGCTCLTKTPETKYHATDCRYRIAQEALDFTSPTESLDRAVAERTHGLRNQITHIIGTRDKCIATLAERDAEIAAMKGQEPVAWVVTLSDGDQFIYDERMLKNIDPELHAKRRPLYAYPVADNRIDIDWLSNVIREADGNHSLGAGELAEKIAAAMGAERDAEIAELKRIARALQMPRPGDDLAKGVCSECKAIGAAYKIGRES